MNGVPERKKCMEKRVIILIDLSGSSYPELAGAGTYSKPSVSYQQVFGRIFEMNEGAAVDVITFADDAILTEDAGHGKSAGELLAELGKVHENQWYSALGKAFQSLYTQVQNVTNDIELSIYLLSDGLGTDEYEPELARLQNCGSFTRAYKAAFSVSDKEGSNSELLSGFTGEESKVCFDVTATEEGAIERIIKHW